jgi:hypothetical protein
MKKLNRSVRTSGRSCGVLAAAIVMLLSLGMFLGARPASAVSQSAGPNQSVVAKGTKTPKPEDNSGRSTSSRSEIEFNGQVQTRPAGVTGIWRIAGRNIVVDANTRFDETRGRAIVGSKVEVKAVRAADGRIRAVSIKAEDRARSAAATRRPVTTARPVATTALRSQPTALPSKSSGAGLWSVCRRAACSEAGRWVTGRSP